MNGLLKNNEEPEEICTTMAETKANRGTLSTVFREKFMVDLKKSLSPFKQPVESRYKHNRVVHSEQPIAGAPQVIEYKGRYTHKEAISNPGLLKYYQSPFRQIYSNTRSTTILTYFNIRIKIISGLFCFLLILQILNFV